MTNTYPNLPPLPPPTPAAYVAHQGAHAMLDFKSKCEGMWLGWVGYQAGKNYFNIHPDAGDAIIYGAHAMRRWWVWIGFLNLWLASVGFLAWMTYLNHHTIRGESYPDISGDLGEITRNVYVFIIPATLAMLVTYCRNIDFSLLRRRWLYKVMQPVCRLVDWFPNWMLYLIVFLPLFFPG